MNDTSQERTEDATPRRRQQARKKGTVTRSQDLTSALVIGVLLIVLPAVGTRIGEAFLRSFQGASTNIPADASLASINHFVWQSAQGPVFALSILMLTVMTVGLASNFAQVGFHLNGEGLNPSLAKLNPVNGLKRLFSVSAGFEGLKAFAKSLVFGYVAYGVMASNWDRIVGSAWADSISAIGFVGELTRVIFLRIGIAWLILAVIDYGFQKRQVEKQLKMTKQELKEEFRETEQAPELKAAMASRRRKLKSRMVDAVKSANVIVTNPTHFSVALKYEPGQMHAPQVVAKGQDWMALKIREIAKENGIPIVPNPPLARQVYKKCDIGDYIPRDMFQAVAEVLAFVYRAARELG
jgi:flagellar biosynthetic protein FlhB